MSELESIKDGIGFDNRATSPSLGLSFTHYDDTNDVRLNSFGATGTLRFKPLTIGAIIQHGTFRQGAFPSRPGSTNQLAGFQSQGPTNEAITLAIRECLGEVDLDNVTKKQLKALAEQKLQCQLSGEKRAFLDSQIDFELANM